MMRGTDPQGHPSDGLGVRLGSGEGRAVIAAAVLGSALAYMSDDMLNVALPSVADDLGVGVSEMQWVVNGYFVTMLSLMLTAGSFGDIRGHRRTFLTGLAVFACGAVVAATAPAIPLLVAGRAVQGVGAALLLACGLALVNGSFGEDERSQAVGTYMGLTAVATAVGPVLGGVLVDLVSWRAIFVAPLVFPLAAAFVTYTAVPETPRNQDRAVDTKGALLAFLTIFTLSFALIRGPAGWRRAEVIVGLAAAVVSALAFVRSQRNGTDPMLPLALFRDRTFAGGNAVTLVSFMVSAGAFLFVVVQLQTTLGYRPVGAGAVFVPLYLIMVVGSPQSGRLADKIGARAPIVAGNLILAAGIWWLSLVRVGSDFLADILPGMIVLAVGLATLGAPLTSATLGAVDQHDQGIASGVNNTVGQLAGLLMIVVLPAVAGLSGKTFDGPEFAGGYQLAMRVCVVLCLVAAGIAGFTIRPRNAPTPALPRT
ncbi:MAG: MFS transporter [Acidimicrobiales bacterium]